jgi:hypothetical protein
MTELTLLEAVAQVGFPIAVAVFLIWKGYTQDKEYLKALQDLATLMREHASQKDAVLELLQKCQEDLRASYLEIKRYPPNP